MADTLTGRKPGYLVSIDNVPPLIFRFQLNPDIMTEKRSYKWDSANKFGEWEFDSAKSLGVSTAAGLLAAALPTTGLLKAQENIKNFSAALVNTRPLEAKEGDPRTFAIDFALDARLADVLDEGDHYGGSIEPDLFVLRSFVNPSMDMVTFGKWMLSRFKRKELPTAPPPLCSLYFAGLAVTCVMTDLSIKVTGLKDDGKPMRAEVSVTLKEQTKSVTPILEFMQRHVNVLHSYRRKNIGTDIMNLTPILSLFT